MKRTSGNSGVARALSFAILTFIMTGGSAQEIVFSSLLDNRETDTNAMAFNDHGDLYFIGAAHGLERARSWELPDGLSDELAASILIPTEDYAQIFEPGRTIWDINGAGIAFDSQGRAITLLEEVYRTDPNDSDTEADRVRFVRYDPEQSCFDGVVFGVGEEISALGLEEDDAFEVNGRDHEPLHMVLARVNGVETILFTLWDVPDLLSAPVPQDGVSCAGTLEGGAVTSVHAFEDGFPMRLTMMERPGHTALLVGHSNGDIYEMDLANGGVPSVLVSKARLLEVIGGADVEDDWGISFVDLDYEPVSDRIYAAAYIPWYTDPDETLSLIAISPDGGELEKVFDIGELTTSLAEIRSPRDPHPLLRFNTVAVNPVAVAQGQSSLFFGDYWHGLYMVRADLAIPPVLTLAEQALHALNYFDAAVASGSIGGGTPLRPINNIQLSQVRGMLQGLSWLLRNLDGPYGQYYRSVACVYGAAILGVTDGVGRYDLRGPGVSELNGMIARIRDSLACRR